MGKTGSLIPHEHSHCITYLLSSNSETFLYHLEIPNCYVCVFFKNDIFKYTALQSQSSFIPDWNYQNQVEVHRLCTAAYRKLCQELVFPHNHKEG